MYYSYYIILLASVEVLVQPDGRPPPAHHEAVSPGRDVEVVLAWDKQLFICIIFGLRSWTWMQCTVTQMTRIMTENNHKIATRSSQRTY